MAAARVSFTWMGTQKTLDRDQKARAAETFGAEGQYLSAGKKLVDTGHAAFRAVTAIRGKVDAYWKGLSLPFPEPGVRLIRHDAVEPFAAQMADFRTELDDAVANLDRHYGELKRAARDRLGSLFNPADYPETLVGLFGVEWAFPSVEPPDYLVQLAPGLYEAERARVAARFEEAVQLAEQAFLDEFARLVAHLDRADLGRGRGRPAAGLPRLRRGQPGRVLRPLPDAERPVERPARRPGRRGAAGRPGRHRPRPPRRPGAAADRRGPAVPGPDVARRAAGRAAPAAHPPAGGRVGGCVMQLVVCPRRSGPGDLRRGDPAGSLGRPRIRRASTVEPDRDGRWHADLGPVFGPVLGPFAARSEALDAEVAWLEAHWLLPPG